MKTDTAQKLARVCTDTEIQKWSSGIGKFVMELHPSVVATANKACDACPMRCMHNIGGCIGEDCPIHAVRHVLNRACARSTAAVKEIYRQKYRHSA